MTINSSGVEVQHGEPLQLPASDQISWYLLEFKELIPIREKSLDWQ